MSWHQATNHRCNSDCTTFHCRRLHCSTTWHHLCDCSRWLRDQHQQELRQWHQKSALKSFPWAMGLLRQHYPQLMDLDRTTPKRMGAWYNWSHQLQYQKQFCQLITHQVHPQHICPCGLHTSSHMQVLLVFLDYQRSNFHLFKVAVLTRRSIHPL